MARALSGVVFAARLLAAWKGDDGPATGVTAAAGAETGVTIAGAGSGLGELTG